MGGLIERFAPRYALKRQLARLAMERLYKAAAPSNARSTPTDWRSGDGVMDQARAKLRTWGRHLDENHDLTHSILNQLSYQASQLEIEPRALTRAGKPADKVNDELRRMWVKHRDQLDASGSMPWCVLASTTARTWFRDGECFAQHLFAAGVRYPTDLKYMLNVHEPDLVPYDLIQSTPATIVHGIEIDELGRPVAYHLYKSHPGDNVSAFASTDTIRIPADQITHLKMTKRLGQKRGASILAPSITRLSDIADYEESERLAAKVASSLCAAITRGADFVNTTSAVDTVSGERPMELQAGMIFDNLAPGERVEIIDTNRPNTGLADFRKAMLRAATAGIGVSYSTSTHDYDGTYSSQRQELVESRLQYDTMRAHYIAGFLRPVWRRFVQAAQLAGVNVAAADPETIFEFEAIAPASPWVDPLKEAKADEVSINAGIESRHGIIRKRGGDPARVDDEREADAPEPADEPAPAPNLELVPNDQPG
tara:strand:- start:1988 stop:3436 length:1449 start_codon:yes stop_codon:yes gene_type:complete